jgi:hypothetical protein
LTSSSDGAAGYAILPMPVPGAGHHLCIAALNSSGLAEVPRMSGVVEGGGAAANVQLKAEVTNRPIHALIDIRAPILQAAEGCQLELGPTSIDQLAFGSAVQGRRDDRAQFLQGERLGQHHMIGGPIQIIPARDDQRDPTVRHRFHDRLAALPAELEVDDCQVEFQPAGFVERVMERAGRSDDAASQQIEHVLELINTMISSSTTKTRVLARAI